MEQMVRGEQYGALELKRAYQMNLAGGLALGVMLHVAAVMSLVWLFRPRAALEIPIQDETTFVVRVARWDDDRPGNAVKQPVKEPNVGVPTAVSDADPSLVYTLPEILPDISGDGDPRGEVGSGTGQGGESPKSGMANGDDSGLPGPNVFVAAETLPVPIKRVPPEYPDIARLSGREGRVTIKALVDIDGTVLRAIVVKASGANAGFEDAAIDAALKCRYKPAIQNGRPVAIWVTYTVEFKLK